MKIKLMNLNDIFITNEYKKTIPNPMNFCKKLSYYKHRKAFSAPIVINTQNVLIDGYITYLIAKMFDISMIETVVINLDTSDQLYEQEMSMLEIIDSVNKHSKNR